MLGRSWEGRKKEEERMGEEGACWTIVGKEHESKERTK
jgi:hypothetical protein